MSRRDRPDRLGFDSAGTAGKPASYAPIISSPNAGTPTSSGTTNATVVSDQGSGRLYWAVVTNGGSATNAQIKAGTGGNIVVAGNQQVNASGTQTVSSITGLTTATTYQILFLHVNPSSQDSNQASVSLTTA